jgi:hypothetical protein
MLPMTKAIGMAIHFSGPPAIIRTLAVTSHAVAVDEGLGRCVDAFARHEGVPLGSALELVILDFESLALQKIKRLEAERTDVLRGHHSV